MTRLKKGDEVIVIAGRDKGRRGSVTSVRADGKVAVQNVNVVKKHQKGNPNRGIPGGIVDKELPIDASNVMLFNPMTGKGDRVGSRVLEDGRKVRYFKSNGEVVDR
ncbi:MAG: 50S ribosomal protein L24 [Thiotrichales bacterium]